MPSRRPLLIGFILIIAVACLMFGCARGLTAGSNSVGGTGGTGGNGGAGSPSSAPQFIYFGGGATAISGIQIRDGKASQVPGSPFTAVSPGNLSFVMDVAGDLLFSAEGRTPAPPLMLTWRVDSVSGALTQIGTNPFVISFVDPKNSFAYTDEFDMHGYSINHQTGQLTEIAGSPFRDVRDVGFQHISLDGTWMCGGGFNGPGTPSFIACDQRDPVTGAILTASGNQVTGPMPGGGPFLAGNYLLTGNYEFDLTIYQVALTGIQQVNSYPSLKTSGFAVDRTGTMVAAPYTNNSTFTLWKFNPADATLTQLAQTSLSFAGATAFSCDGKYLAVANGLGDGLVTVYSVSNNQLQEISGSPVPVAKGASSIGAAACFH